MGWWEDVKHKYREETRAGCISWVIYMEGSWSSWILLGVRPDCVSGQKLWPRNKRAEPIDGSSSFGYVWNTAHQRKAGRPICCPGSTRKPLKVQESFRESTSLALIHGLPRTFGVFMSSKDNYSACLRQDKRNSTLGSVLRYFLPCSLLRDFLLWPEKKTAEADIRQP